MEIGARTRHGGAVMLLVPADVLQPGRPDEHFAPEAAAARDAGIPVALVDHDALQQPDSADRAVARVTATGQAVYRGWMLRSEKYAAFAAALARRGVTLCTSPVQYRQAHELPGWHAALASHTPESAWTAGTARADFDRCRAALGSGPAVIRDYTKSMKHHWHDAMYLPDVADGDTAWSVASRFLQLRDDDLVGGLVLRRYEHFASTEARTWWINGRCVLVTAHPDSPETPPPADPDLTAVAPLVAALALPFVTVDLARRNDGAWRIVELGDGQVSDRPTTLDPAQLIAALHPDTGQSTAP